MLEGLMRNPAMLSRVAGVVGKLSTGTLTECRSTEAREAALDALQTKAEDPAAEVFTFEVQIEGRPVLLMGAGPAGTRAALGI